MAEKKYKDITVVNEKDEVIGAFPLFEAIKQNMIRRVVWIYVFDHDGRVLIQQRSPSVIDPMKLDVSVGGHVDKDESYESTAVMEMQEELGIKIDDVEIKEIALSYRTTGFFGTLYRVNLPKDYEIVPNKDEVYKIFLLTPDEVDDLVSTKSKECANSLLETWMPLRDKLLST